MIALRLKPERIELGVKVAAHPVSADQHQRPYRVSGCLGHVRRHLRAGLAFGFRLGSELVSDRGLDLRPVAVERRCQFVARRLRPIGLFPGWTIGILAHIIGLVAQAAEKFPPLRVNGSRILLEPGVKFVDIAGVGALQKRRQGESGISVLAGHRASWAMGVASGGSQTTGWLMKGLS